MGYIVYLIILGTNAISCDHCHWPFILIFMVTNWSNIFQRVEICTFNHIYSADHVKITPSLGVIPPLSDQVKC